MYFVVVKFFISQEADLIMAPITINSQREKVIDFTTQFYAEVVGVGIKTSDSDWFYLFRPLQVNTETKITN